jgi:CRP/FNR family transcriptional regulator
MTGLNENYNTEINFEWKENLDSRLDNHEFSREEMSVAQQKGYLHDSPYVFGYLGKYSQKLALLLYGSQVRKCCPNEILFQHGEVSDHFYFIKTGKIKITLENADGLEKIVAIQECDTFAGDCTLDGFPYPWTAVALEESELHMIKKAWLQTCVRKSPDVALMVIESVIRKMRLLVLQVNDLSLRSASGRVANTLLALARDTGHENKDGLVINMRITHETLAGLTGLARPTVSAVLSSLQKLNIVMKKRETISILDIKQLLDIIASSRTT